MINIKNTLRALLHPDHCSVGRKLIVLHHREIQWLSCRLRFQQTSPQILKAYVTVLIHLAL